MKKISRREFLTQSSVAVLVTAGMGSIAWVGGARAEEIAKIGDRAQFINSPNYVDPKDIAAAKEHDTTPVENQVPYISYYYIEPKISLNDRAVIQYYVTDYWHKDYVEEDNSERFMVEYWVNGKKTTLKNVRAGDNSITLPQLPQGKVLFAIQCTDSQGRESHRLYQEFLVVDPSDKKVPVDKVYQANLARFGISNNDANPVETALGLTQMLQWASDNGYRKVVLPKGTYRISELHTVQMATNLTLDMNGAKFKLNPNASNKAQMLRIDECFDSHVINGEFEGDLQEHDFVKDPISEHVHAVGIGGYSEYCSFENISIHDVTGYGTTTDMRGVKRGYTTVRSVSVSGFKAGDINKKGDEVSSNSRVTTEELIDVSQYAAGPGFFQMGVYLGYQGNPAGKWPYRAHFYDGEQKFIETIPAFMYRRVYLPQNARFVKFTLLSLNTPKLSLFDFHHPYNCTFRNVRHEDIRCVGMAPAGFTNLLVEGCTFDNCGWESAKCAFDSEDGWDMQQDLTFRNNIFGAKKENRFNEFVTPDGVDYVVENNVMSLGIYSRTKSSIFRNNQFKSGSFYIGQHDRTLYQRIYNNTFSELVTIQKEDSAGDKLYPFRETTFAGGVFFKSGKEVVPLVRCKYVGGKLQNWTDFLVAFKKDYLNVQEFNLEEDWKFLPDPAKGRNPANPQFNDNDWKTISSKKQWQLQGYPQYHDIGWYRKSVKLPANMEKRTTILFFGACDGNVEVFVNGTKIGEHLLGDGFSGWDEPFQFDISENIKAGNNLIAVRVHSKSQDTAAGLTEGAYLVTGERTFHE